MHRKVLCAVAAALVVLVAGLVFDEWIVMRPLDRGQLARLVVPTAPPGFTQKPASSTLVESSSSPLTEARTAAEQAPSQTGSWATTWDTPKASNDSASVLVTYLPSASEAALVEKQAETQFLGANSFQSQSYALVGPVAVTGVPGARGAVFKPSGTATTPPVASVVFSYGRAQVLVILGQTGTPAATGAAAAILSRSEYAHLQADLAGFRMGHVTRVPLIASLAYWGVLAGVMALAVFIPLGMRRRRRRRAEARRRIATQQHQLRGAKIARRQASRRR
jgi:hypothetical protein